MPPVTPLPPARRKRKTALRVESQAHADRISVDGDPSVVDPSVVDPSVGDPDDGDPDEDRIDGDRAARTRTRDVLASLAHRAARVAVPAAAWCARGSARAVMVVGAAAWRRRSVLQALFARGMWWAALVAWAVTVVALWGVDAIDVDRSLAVFTAGAIACVAVVALGRAGHLRWLGGVLGSMHGVSAVLLWSIANV